MPRASKRTASKKLEPKNLKKPKKEPEVEEEEESEDDSDLEEERKPEVVKVGRKVTQSSAGSPSSDSLPSTDDAHRRAANPTPPPTPYSAAAKPTEVHPPTPQTVPSTPSLQQQTPSTPTIAPRTCVDAQLNAATLSAAMELNRLQHVGGANKEEDHLDAFGRYIAGSLRQLPPLQQELAKHEMESAAHKAKMLVLRGEL